MIEASKLAAAFLLLDVISIGVMLALARAFGICVLSITFGRGPTIMKWSRLTLRLLPIGSAIHMKDTRVLGADPDDTANTFNYAAPWMRLALCLAWPLLLVAIAYVALGEAASSAFLSTYGQAVQGAISPAGEAQELLSQATALLATSSFVAVVGVLAAKLAALHTVPQSSSNLAQAAFTVLYHRSPEGDAPQSALRVAYFFSIVVLVVFCMWLVAVAVYLAS